MINKLLLLLFFFKIVYGGAVTYYVDPSSNCIKSCGNKTSPFRYLSDAIAIASKNNIYDCDDSNLIYMNPGIYKGSLNKDLYINQPIEIKSTSSNSNQQTIIDCEFTSTAFKVYKANIFSMSGITIRNCVANYGGALNIQQTDSTLSNMRFESNRATYGGAIYSSQKNLNIVNVTFTSNLSLKSGGALYTTTSNSKITFSNFSCNTISNTNRNDISCDKSKITLTNTLVDGVGFTCSKTCFITDLIKKNSFCLNQPKLCSLNGNITNGNSNNNNSTTQPPVIQGSCSILNTTLIQPMDKKENDGICNPIFENCLNSPNDCKSCYFSGLVLESFKSNGTSASNISNFERVTIGKVNSFEISNFMKEQTSGAVLGKVFGYFKVEISDYYSITSIGDYIGAKVYFNSVPVLNSFFQRKRLNSTADIYLEKDIIHKVTAEFFSLVNSGPRNFKLIFKSKLTNELLEPFFYSKNICGDGIYDEEIESESCPTDREPFNIKVSSQQSQCKELDPNRDFVNCYQRITPICPTRQVFGNHLSPGYSLRYDSLGDLISNNMIWRLNGVERMTFALNIITGEEASAPIFYFGFCDSTGSNLVEDVYRGKVYDVPKEINARVTPMCQFNTETQFFKNSSEISTRIYQASTKEYGGSAGGGYAGYKAEANVAFTEEKSVEKAKTLQKSQDETIIRTELNCTTSVMELTNIKSFHPLFLQSLSLATTVEDMYLNVIKYGTHFYRKAVFGGKLVQYTVTKNVKQTEESKEEWRNAASRSFGGGVSGKYFSVNANYQDSIDTTISGEQQQTMESESRRSTIITYGGPLGAYSSDQTQDQESNNFADWAGNVDTLPIPIDFDLYPIRDILDPRWNNSKDTNILELWIKAEEIFYQKNNYQIENQEDFVEDYSLIITFNSYADRVANYFNVKWNYTNENYNGILNERSFKVRIPFVDTKDTGIESEEYILYFGNPKGISVSEPTFKYFTDWPTGLDYSNYQWKFDYVHNNVGGLNKPYIYHFKAPDFFADNVVGVPVFSFDDYSQLQDIISNIQLISWKTKKATMLYKSSNRNNILSVDNYNANYYNLRLETLYTKKWVAPYSVFNDDHWLCKMSTMSPMIMNLCSKGFQDACGEDISGCSDAYIQFIFDSYMLGDLDNKDQTNTLIKALKMYFGIKESETSSTSLVESILIVLNNQIIEIKNIPVQKSNNQLFHYLQGWATLSNINTNTILVISSKGIMNVRLSWAIVLQSPVDGDWRRDITITYPNTTLEPYDQFLQRIYKLVPITTETKDNFPFHNYKTKFGTRLQSPDAYYSYEFK